MSYCLALTGERLPALILLFYRSELNRFRLTDYLATRGRIDPVRSLTSLYRRPYPLPIRATYLNRSNR